MGIFLCFFYHSDDFRLIEKVVILLLRIADVYQCKGMFMPCLISRQCWERDLSTKWYELRVKGVPRHKGFMHNYRETRSGCVFLLAIYVWLSSIIPLLPLLFFYLCQKSPTNPLVRMFLFLAAKLSSFFRLFSYYLSKNLKPPTKIFSIPF